MTQRNPEKTRADILAAATELFGAYGLHGVGTAAIAEKAGVNKALIFYHFGTKDGLYAEVFSGLVGGMVERLRENLAEAPPGVDAIETFIRTHVAFMRENRELLPMMLRELLLSDEALSPLLARNVEFIKTIRNELLMALSNARKSGETRDVDPLQTVVSIVSLDIFYFLGRPLVRMINQTTDTEAFEAKRVDHIVDLLLHGLKAREGDNHA